MSSGENYIPAPYNTVRAYTTNVNDASVPSGATIVGGAYYRWVSSSGFTGVGWFTHMPGPTENYFGLNADASEIEEYLQALEDKTGNANLDTVFQEWLNSGVSVSEYTDFMNAVDAADGDLGCVTIVGTTS